MGGVVKAVTKAVKDVGKFVIEDVAGGALKAVGKATGIVNEPEVTSQSSEKQYAQDTMIEEGASEDKKRKFSKANRMKGQLRSSSTGSEGTAGANV